MALTKPIHPLSNFERACGLNDTKREIGFRRVAGAFEQILRVYHLEGCGHFVQEADMDGTAGIDSIIMCPYCTALIAKPRKRRWWRFWRD